MRTLVVSDLHLGMRRRRDVLTRPEALAALLAALDGCERLVLLGDVVELSGRAAARAMAVAEPVLRAIGERLGAEREVVLVPGNHDRALVRPWVQQMGARLAVEGDVPLDVTTQLAAMRAWLAPTRVSARYPGVWLTPSVWAPHGHYLNRHLFPPSSLGIARGLLGRLPATPPGRSITSRGAVALWGACRRPSPARFPRHSATRPIASASSLAPRRCRRRLTSCCGRSWRRSPPHCSACRPGWRASPHSPT